MSEDRELLELAAKAAGMRLAKRTSTFGHEYLVNLGDDWSVMAAPMWNPVLDDGDALRLACKLRINIEYMKTLGGEDFGVNAWPNGRGDCGVSEDGDLSNYEAATRRAIVRAAAELGRAMKDGAPAVPTKEL